MDIELIYRVSSVTVIISTLVAAIAGGTQWWTGNIISNRQETKIAAMEKDARIRKPSIFSQETISQNIPDGDMFIQRYLISTNSPIQHVPLYTRILYDIRNGDIERIGEMELNDVGKGVRQIENHDVSYVDTVYTIKTNRMLLAGETIIFSLEKPSNIPVK